MAAWLLKTRGQGAQSLIPVAVRRNWSLTTSAGDSTFMSSRGTAVSCKRNVGLQLHNQSSQARYISGESPDLLLASHIMSSNRFYTQAHKEWADNVHATRYACWLGFWAQCTQPSLGRPGCCQLSPTHACSIQRVWTGQVHANTQRAQVLLWVFQPLVQACLWAWIEISLRVQH